MTGHSMPNLGTVCFKTRSVCSSAVDRHGAIAIHNFPNFDGRFSGGDQQRKHWTALAGPLPEAVFMLYGSRKWKKRASERRYTGGCILEKSLNFRAS